MIPSAANSDYPIFVADQVLTSDNLNDLFGYLDEQGRMTRTNLIGMGIVCGLQPVAAADGKSIKITKGVGVTSSGYLVSVPEINYTKRTSNFFDAVKCAYYDKFVDVSQKKQRFDLWELKQESESVDTVGLDPAFLSNKVVLIFVELLEENNKNCDPDSCDDKGTKVTVNFRPLLAAKADVDSFLSNSSNNSATGNAVLLPETKMPRYDVPATLLLDTQDVFHAYQQILTQSFIVSVKTALSGAYTKLVSLLSDKYASDPFTTLDTKFAFLFDGTITQDQALTLQYYYDFFSDLLIGYEELRRKAAEVVCECLPDELPFPRHLLLGEAIGFNEMKSLYRTRFISSPVLCCCADDAHAVKFLFDRLVLMIDNLSVQVLVNTNISTEKKQMTPVKVTPSMYGAMPLSDKAIPFYYNVNSGGQPLYLTWNSKRTATNTATGILSYKSFDYNTTDDYVKQPLKYDLEPNNFLRIEGHIGHDYRKVLIDLDAIKKSNRLPIDIVALSSDTRGIVSITNALTQMDTTGSVALAFLEMIKHPCCFADLFLALDEWINKLRCCLAEQMRYYMQLPSFKAEHTIMTERKFFSKTIPADNNFEIRDNTIGQLYKEKLDAGTINNQFCSDVFVNIATGNAQAGSALVMMPYKIDRLTEILPQTISDLDAKELEARYADLTGTATQMRNLYASPNVAGTMQGVDMTQLSSRLEMNCLICLFLEFRLLVREFLMRLLSLMLKQKLGYYAYNNPGIQHKAGVPMGGTFIIVYHELTELLKADGSFKEGFSKGFAVERKAGISKTAGLYSGSQTMLSEILLTEEKLFIDSVSSITIEPDEVLDPIVHKIVPGTVIADFFLPYMCCSDCPPTQLLVMPAPETPNQPPVAKPGDNLSIQLPTNSVTLDGSSSTDPDGTIQTYKWEQVSGPSTAGIQSADNATTNVSGLVLGTYVFKLTVTDNAGASSSDTVTVTVTQKPNIPPNAVATTDKPIVILPDNTARLIGNNSTDPDGNIVSYMWSTTSTSGGATIQTANAATTNVLFTQTGVYVFTLKVTDDRGDSDTADVTIFVNEAPNQPPIAKAAADPSVLELGSTAAAKSVLSSNGSVDPDGSIVSFEWSLPTGTTGAQIQSPASPTTEVTFSQAGNYVFTLKVKDNKGATDTASAVVNVTKPEVPQKTCSSLAGIIAQFNNLKNIDTAGVFKAFTSAYTDFKDVQAFYKDMEANAIASKSVDDQLNFFASKNIDAVLVKWIIDLRNMIIENTDFRLLALNMLNIHAQLAYYIACIQVEDVDKARVPMARPIDALISVLNRMLPGVPNYTAAQRDVLKQLLSITLAEKTRTAANGEQNSKTLYTDMINKIISILQAMNL